MERRQFAHRRRHHRIGAPGMAVEIGPYRGRVRDWSIGGLSMEVEKGERLPERDLPVSGRLGRAGGGRRFDFRGRVVRTEPGQRIVALEFADVSDGLVGQFAESLRLMAAGLA